MTQLSRFTTLSLAGITMLAACGGSTRSAAIDSTSGRIRSDTGPGSGGAGGMASESQMQTAVEANMRVMTGASARQLQAMLPEHRQLVSSMLGQMTHEMGSVHTATSAAWMATRDSVNGDLARLPTMNGTELQAMMPGHVARLHRLMQMRVGMKGGMGRMMNP